MQIRPAIGKTKTSSTVLALILREMSTTYGRSSMGYLWAILEPVAAISLLSIIFSMAFRVPPIGNSFPLFYATGYLAFMIFMDISQKLSKTIVFSRPLLFYPAVTFIDALIARFILNFLTHIMIFYLVMTGIVMGFGARVEIDFVSIISAILMASTLAIGIGTLNCYLYTRYPSWERFWSILTRPLFIISTILFTFETVPAVVREYLWYNPLVHIVGKMRAGFYATYDGNYVSVSYVYAISAISTAVGLMLLYRFHQDASER
jgi:capsular polysaccharide transport system permease protein